MYILCFAQKDRLRGDFGPLQSRHKGVISKIGLHCGGYAYILSMGKDRVRVENTHSFAFFLPPRRWTAIGVGALRDQTATTPLPPRYHPRAAR
jgi:hypothetical protein